ncbi:MAG: potassium channel family protein [Eggerthellales bacterium]|nr:potassium channel family protein [Eggerthellales bacterium]
MTNRNQHCNSQLANPDRAVDACARVSDACTRSDGARASDERNRAGRFDRRFKYRAVLPIIRAAGLGYATVVFALVFLGASATMAWVEPNLSFGNCTWICFQAVSTIGFGDMTVSHAVSRACIVVVSLFSIIYLAVLTGVVVAYCTEMMKSRTESSIAAHLSDLENLDKLTPEELKELSVKIRRGL